MIGFPYIPRSREKPQDETRHDIPLKTAIEDRGVMIGNIVYPTVLVIKEREPLGEDPLAIYPYRVAVRYIPADPKPHVYLGATWIRTGVVHLQREETVWEEYDRVDFIVEDAIKVHVVQPLDPHGRYRRPVHAAAFGPPPLDKNNT